MQALCQPVGSAGRKWEFTSGCWADSAPVNTPTAPSPLTVTLGWKGGKMPSLARPELMLADKGGANLPWHIAGSKRVFDETFPKIILWSKEEKIYWPFSSGNKASRDCSCFGCEAGAKNSPWLNPKRVWSAGVWPLVSMVCTHKNSEHLLIHLLSFGVWHSSLCKNFCLQGIKNPIGVQMLLYSVCSLVGERVCKYLLLALTVGDERKWVWYAVQRPMEMITWPNQPVKAETERKGQW